MKQLLQCAVDLHLLRPLDRQFALLIADENQPLLMLLVAYLSAEVGAGNVCLPLPYFTQERLFNGRHPVLAAQIWHCAGAPNVERCLQALQASNAVSSGEATPLVLEQQRLYLQRLWQDERRVEDFLLRNTEFPATDPAPLRLVLDTFFPTSMAEVNRQKIAAAVAMTRPVSVISGGPGTGKTTTVARLLAALLRISSSSLRIQLAAPTGKAAVRLTESLTHSLNQLALTATELACFPREAVTLHRLLGAQPDSQHLRYHADNRLNLDVLVVDEASMVDLSMMARLVEALPLQARLILLGDRDQLASVEAGAVLGDICRLAEQGYSVARAAELSQLTGYVLSGTEHVNASPVRDSLCLLRQSYRFSAESGIGQLALAVNTGDSLAARSCLHKGHADLTYSALQSSTEYSDLLKQCVQGYRDYLQLVAKQADVAVILRAFAQFQVLCAVREGLFGVNGLNQQIEHALQHEGAIDKSERWYIGRPVMILRNDSALGLFNGDMGIALLNEQGQISVYFLLADGKIKGIQPNRLPEHETAYAMTVHKSQGSEFEHTLLVFPDQPSPLLTRELLYTAITRARTKLTLYARENLLQMAINTPTERSSGLLALR